MASRRQLKKAIKAQCEVMNLVLFFKSLIQQDNEAASTVKELNDVLIKSDELLRRISHTEKGSEKQYYRKLKQEFGQLYQEVIQKANAQ